MPPPIRPDETPSKRVEREFLEWWMRTQQEWEGIKNELHAAGQATGRTPTSNDITQEQLRRMALRGERMPSVERDWVQRLDETQLLDVADAALKLPERDACAALKLPE